MLTLSGTQDLLESRIERLARFMQRHPRFINGMRVTYTASNFISGVSSMKRVLDKHNFTAEDYGLLVYYLAYTLGTTLVGSLNGYSSYLFAKKMDRALDVVAGDHKLSRAFYSLATALTPPAAMIVSNNLGIPIEVLCLLALNSFATVWPIFYEDFPKFQQNLGLYKSEFVSFVRPLICQNSHTQLQDDPEINPMALQQNRPGNWSLRTVAAAAGRGLVDTAIVTFPVLGTGQSVGYVGIVQKVVNGSNQPLTNWIIYPPLLMARAPFVMDTYATTIKAWNNYKSDQDNAFAQHKKKLGLNFSYALAFALIIYANSSALDSIALTCFLMACTIAFGTFGRLKNIFNDNPVPGNRVLQLTGINSQNTPQPIPLHNESVSPDTLKTRRTGSDSPTESEQGGSSASIATLLPTESTPSSSVMPSKDSNLSRTNSNRK